MGQQARKKSLEGATSYDTQPRKLFYRPHLRWSYFCVLGLAVFVECLAIIAGVLFALESGALLGFIVYATFSLASLLLFFEARFLLRPLAYSYVQLFAKHLHLSRIGKSINIPYSEISGVKFFYLPYVAGGFVLYSKNQRPLRFTVVLERSELILDTLVAHRPELFDEKKFFKYRRTAISSDHSWARVYEKARRWPRLVSKTFLFPILAGSLASFFVGFKENSSALALVYSFMKYNFLMVIAFYFFEEFLIAKKLRSKLIEVPSALSRDRVFERKTHFKVQSFYYGVAVAVCLYLALQAKWLAN